MAARLSTYGFYPAGGGRFSVVIEPCQSLAALDLLERGPIVERDVRAIVANLPEHIAEREIDTVLQKMGWEPK